MAAKKNNFGGAIGGVFTAVAVVVIVYFGYRLLKPAAAQAATSPGGIYGNGGYDPYNPYSQPNTGGGGLLSSLLRALGLGGGSSSGGARGSLSGGSGSGGSGSGGGSGSKLNTASYGASSPMADIYNSIVEGLYGNGLVDGSESNPDLGGYSLQTYQPDYSGDLSGYQIPYQDAGQQWDFGGGQPYTGGYSNQDYQDNGSNGYADTTSYTDAGGIDGGGYDSGD
jgi:hypothetical protein